MSSQNQSSPRRFKIAVIAGDGIGVEISEAAIQVLQKLSDTCGIFAFDFQHLDYSSKNYLERGYYMPEGGLESLQKFDAIYFGAVGWPGLLHFPLAFSSTVVPSVRANNNHKTYPTTSRSGV